MPRPSESSTPPAFATGLASPVGIVSAAATHPSSASTRKSSRKRANGVCGSLKAKRRSTLSIAFGRKGRVLRKTVPENTFQASVENAERGQDDPHLGGTRAD